MHMNRFWTRRNSYPKNAIAVGLGFILFLFFEDSIFVMDKLGNISLFDFQSNSFLARGDFLRGLAISNILTKKGWKYWGS